MSTEVTKKREDELLPFLMKAAQRADLPDSLTPERLAKAAAVSIQKNPDLADPKKTDRGSLALALIEAGQAGLEPDGRYAALVSYKDKDKGGIGIVQFQAMTQGLIELARRGGEVLDIDAFVVHSGDQFDYELGLTPRLVHKPALSRSKDATITHAYAIVRYRDGRPPKFEVMDRAEIENVRKRSRAKTGPWMTDFGEMCRKTVVKRRLKYERLSYTDRMILQRDDEIEYTEAVVEENEPEELAAGTPNTAKLRQIAAGKRKKAPEPPVPSEPEVPAETAAELPPVETYEVEGEVVDTDTGEIMAPPAPETGPEADFELDLPSEPPARSRSQERRLATQKADPDAPIVNMEKVEAGISKRELARTYHYLIRDRKPTLSSSAPKLKAWEIELYGKTSAEWTPAEYEVAIAALKGGF